MSTTVMECNIGFTFFKKFDKAVNSFVNPRDMHAFPTILNKIEVKDDNNDLSIGKKFENSSESERKEAYKKASLEHKKSKDRRHNWSTSNQKINRISFLTIIRRMWMKSSRKQLPKL